ncbi:MAG: PilZ domain-containing protein [Candidatus Omnitrophica bacterium]|nr:PilZ domain-containing protein [Candidatus Omnitrophota bacterium]
MERPWRYWLLRIFRGEKRIERRVYVGDVLDLAFRASGEQLFHYDCAARDISSRGLRFAYQYPLERGARVHFLLGFPARYKHPEKAEIQAQVVHCYKLKDQRRYRIGCEFLETNTEDYAEIRRFLDWLQKGTG